MKRFTALIMVCLVLIAVAGCSGSAPAQSGANNTSSSGTPAKEEKIMTERQKEILAAQGLPTDFSSLSVTQTSAIIAIEDMLCYLESSYNDTFTYSAYWSGADGTGERMEASCSLGTVTVYSSYDGAKFNYTDNYTMLKAIPLYREVLTEKLDSVFGTGSYKLFITPSALAGGTVDKNTVTGLVSGNMVIVVDAAAVSDLKAAAGELGKWYCSSPRSCSVSLIFYSTTAEQLKSIADYNLDDFIYSHTRIESVLCTVNASGYSVS